MKPNGAFAQLDLRFDDHAKYYEYGAAEMGLIACAITLSNRQRGDGLVPRAWPVRRFGAEIQPTVDRLVADGVWRRRSDGNFEIVGYLDHNHSKAEIEAYMAAKAQSGKLGGQKSAAARAQASGQPPAQPPAQAPAQAPASTKKKANAKARAQVSGEPRQRHRPRQDSQTKPEPDPPPPVGVQGETNGTVQHAPMRSLPPSEQKLWGELWIEKYEQAVAKALERPWSFERKQLSCLNDLIGAHCQDKTKVDLWVMAIATAFVGSVRGDDPKFWSSYQPKGLMRWLNEGHGKQKASGGSGSEYPSKVVGGVMVPRG